MNTTTQITKINRRANSVEEVFQEPTARTRSRAGKLATQQMIQLAESVFSANKVMNAAKSAHDGARKALLESMNAAGLTEFDLSIGILSEAGDPITVPVHVEVDTPAKNAISIEKLRKLVKDEATFLKIVSATKKSVEAHVGSIVATEATILVNGTQDVFVRAQSKKTI